MARRGKKEKKIREKQGKNEKKACKNDDIM
jgi:hypothetical protein